MKAFLVAAIIASVSQLAMAGGKEHGKYMDEYEHDEYDHDDHEEWEHKSYKPTKDYELKVYDKYEEEEGKRSGNGLIGKPILCPKLKHCKRIHLGRPKFELIGPSSQTICVFTRDQTSSCNLSIEGGFCFLEGKYFGPEKIHYKETKDAILTFLDC